MADDDQDAEEGGGELFADGKEGGIPEVVEANGGKDNGEELLEGDDCEGAKARVLPDPGEPALATGVAMLKISGLTRSRSGVLLTVIVAKGPVGGG